MRGILIQYSEDFRDNKKAGKIYGVIRDNGFHPKNVKVFYEVNLGRFIVEYTFRDKEKMPKKLELEKMLKMANLNLNLMIVESKKWPSEK